jgi:hypothetical protein
MGTERSPWKLNTGCVAEFRVAIVEIFRRSVRALPAKGQKGGQFGKEGDFMRGPIAAGGRQVYHFCHWEHSFAQIP